MKQAEPKAELGYGQYYRDKWGQMWKRLDAWTVWKPDTGYGGWYDGRGLEVV